ncbi:hypothetical protein [Acinetobacter pollinis]|uniref:Uncharacterized protein n=1 Tax=Acinetobacter pollinis TaxID=2605270 RepID=A0ABU6DRL1_9GAMM|nr:hypothetical protein [Acinetobacter pollinis]MEB5475518.1 hypothetical protein [Acinetobacter pollinis]
MSTLMLNNMNAFEWLGREMRAKIAQYEISLSATGEKPPNWEEKAGVFALMDDDLQKDLAFLLAYGDWKDGSAQYKKVLQFLTSSIFVVADQEKKRNKDKLPEVCQKIANMELYYFLHDHLDTKFTLEGKLWFAGIDMETKTYQNNWKHFGDATRMMLDQAKESAVEHIEKYRRDLRVE